MKDIKLIHRINNSDKSMIKNVKKLSYNNQNSKLIFLNILNKLSLSIQDKFKYNLSNTFAIFTIVNISFYIISMIGITSLSIKENKFTYQAQKVNNELNFFDKNMTMVDKLDESKAKLFINKKDYIKQANIKYIAIDSDNYVAQN